MLLNSTLDVSGQLHAPTDLLPGDRVASTSLIDWVSSRAVLVGVEKRKSLVSIGNRTTGL
jgi:hypothetical protein